MRIEDIKIGGRIRNELGNIESLANSIDRIGLLHPIVVDSDNKLIAGLRRIEAFKSLNRDEIPHRTINSLDELYDYLIAEKDENVERKGFTPLEALEMAKAIEGIERAAAKGRHREASSAGGKSKKKGSAKLSHPSKRSREKVADAVGMSHATLKKIETVRDLAKNEPDKYNPILKEMEETGKVDPAFRKASKIYNEDNLTIKEKVKRDLSVQWMALLAKLQGAIVELSSNESYPKLINKWENSYRIKASKRLQMIIDELTKMKQRIDELCEK